MDNDSGPIEAAKELDTEFPGADYDESLHNYLIYKVNKECKKGIVKKIVLHVVFYSSIVIGICLLFLLLTL